MTIYNLLYVLNLAGAGAASFLVGSLHERAIWAGLFIYWLFVWLIAITSHQFIRVDMLACMVIATALMLFHRDNLDWLLIAVFTALVLLSALTGLGLLSQEPGRGAFAHTYWNYRTWLLHLACFILIGNCYVRRSAA